MRHRFHAICPYFAMFPERFVEQWLDALTEPGDLVLDPYCGRGTAPFQSLLMGRRAIGNDINPVAYCVTRAKTNAPSAASLRRRLTMLEQEYRQDDWEAERGKLPAFFRTAYQAKTLRQVLFLRSALRWQTSDVDCMLAALALGQLHGESARSPSYLSNQMPRTISTKPAYSLRFWRELHLKAPHRNAWYLLRKAIAYRYASTPPATRASVFHGDIRGLPSKLNDAVGKIKCVITSPPYLDVTCFEEDQWLRLWFLGGPPRPTYGLVSRDDRHERKDAYWSLIGDTWRVLGHLCAPNANVVIRIGGKGLTPKQIVDGTAGTGAFARRRVDLVRHEISAIPRRQTDVFRPGSKGCLVEVDCHFRIR